MISPQQPGYEFATGDLARVRIGPRQAAQIIAQYFTDNGGAGPDPSLLLAALLKDQLRWTVDYLVTPFRFESTFPEGVYQQIVPENPMRKALWLMHTHNDFFGPEVYFLFEPGPLQPEIISFTKYEEMRKRALDARTFHILTEFPLIGADAKSEQFFHTPTNPISFFVRPGSDGNGMIIQGT